MSGFSRGVADAMLEGRAASAESKADGLQREVWRLERELREAGPRRGSGRHGYGKLWASVKVLSRC